MFGLGFAEILFIAVIGLLVIGPEKLPFFVKEIASWLYKLRRSWNNLKYEVKDELDQVHQPKELKKVSQSLKFLKDSVDLGEAPLEKLIGKQNKKNMLNLAKEMKDITLEPKPKVKKRAKKITKATK